MTGGLHSGFRSTLDFSVLNARPGLVSRITLEPYIAAFDHWVAAILLALVASRMIWAGSTLNHLLQKRTQAVGWCLSCYQPLSALMPWQWD